MKRIVFILLILLPVLLSAPSCTVTKRHFRKGWQVEWKTKPVAETEREPKTERETERETVSSHVELEIRLTETEVIPATDAVQPEEQLTADAIPVEQKPVLVDRKPMIRSVQQPVQERKIAPAKTVAFSIKTRPHFRSVSDGEFLGISRADWKDYLLTTALLLGIAALIVLSFLYPSVAMVLGALMALAGIAAVIWVFWKICSFMGQYLFWSGR